ASAMPGFTAPVVGSERMSERFSFSSTKYGPSVSAGRTMHDGVATAAPVVDTTLAPGTAVPTTAVALAVGVAALSAPGPHAAASPDAPSRARTSRRDRMRPIGAS